MLNIWIQEILLKLKGKNERKTTMAAVNVQGFVYNHDTKYSGRTFNKYEKIGSNIHI